MIGAYCCVPCVGWLFRMTDSTTIPTDPRKALVVVRLLWAALLLGQLIFFAVLVLVLLPDEPDIEMKSTAKQLYYISAGLLFVGLFVGYTLRNQAYKQHWEDEVVTPAGYFKGNLILWVITDMIALFALVIVLLAGELFPYLWVAIGAMASIVINFPNGRIMFPPRDELT